MSEPNAPDVLRPRAEGCIKTLNELSSNYGVTSQWSPDLDEIELVLRERDVLAKVIVQQDASTSTYAFTPRIAEVATAALRDLHAKGERNG